MPFQVMCRGSPAQWIWLMNPDHITERETGWKLQLHALCLLKCFLEEQHCQHAAEQPPTEALNRHVQSLSRSSWPCHVSRWHTSCCGSQTLRGGVVYHPWTSKKTSKRAYDCRMKGCCLACLTEMSGRISWFHQQELHNDYIDIDILCQNN